MQAVGLSMALAPSSPALLCAKSEYRRELETDIEPFKGSLLGLFLHRGRHEHRLRSRLRQPLLIAAVVVGFLLLKAAVLGRCARRCRFRSRSARSS